MRIISDAEIDEIICERKTIPEGIVAANHGFSYLELIAAKKADPKLAAAFAGNPRPEVAPGTMSEAIEKGAEKRHTLNPIRENLEPTSEFAKQREREVKQYGGRMVRA